MRVITQDTFDSFSRELFDYVEKTPGPIAIDTETTWIDAKRGFNPFSGTRAALVQLSWNTGGDEFDVALPVRMKRAIMDHPMLAKGNKGEPKERRDEWKAAHKLWCGIKNEPGDGDVSHFEKLEWAHDQIEIETPSNLDIKEVITFLGKLTQLGVVWVMKNCKFDLLMLAADGWSIPPVEQIEDAEVQSHLTEDKPWQRGVPVNHKLQSLAERHLGRDPDASNALDDWFERLKVKPAALKDYSAAPLSILAPYGCQDTRDTLDLFLFFSAKMERQDKESVKGKTLYSLYREEVETIHNLVSHTITDGCAVDADIADTLLEKYTKIRNIHEKQLFALTGEHVEWSSNDKVAAYLFDAKPTGLGLPMPEFAILNSGKRSVSKGVLEAIDTPLTQELLDWRLADTFVTSFLEPIARFNIDGFIHPDFWLTTARTGRMSCTHPNFQNRPKDEDVRSMFVPRPGYVFMDLDYDQIEMRLAAHFAHRVVKFSPKLSYQSWWNGKPSRWITTECKLALMHKRFNEDPDYDPHMTMVERSGLPRKRSAVGEITAKEANFAILYGVGIKGMGRNFGWEPARAKQIKGHWRKSYPEIVHLQHYLTNILYQRGYIANEFGRRYYVDKDKTYLGLNYLIQGCAGDLMKRAMNKVYALQRLLQEEHEGAKPMYLTNVVHDELLLEVREDLMTEELARRVACEMTEWKRDGKPMFEVPISVGCEVSESDWGSLREYPI